MRVDYYITPNKENPVKDFLNSLNKRQKAKIFRILQNIEDYGLSSVIPHLKKLSETPFWEIRVLGNDNIRVIYIVPTKTSILLLHGFQKKTQKTPQKEINTAYSRYQNSKLDL